MTKVTEIALEDERSIGLAEAGEAVAEQARSEDAGRKAGDAAPAQAASAPPPSPPRSWLTIIACGVAMFAAATSITSVVIAGQATSRAGEIVEKMETDRARIDRLAELLKRVEAIAPPAEHRPAAQPPGEGELRAALADLRQDIARYGGAQALPIVRDGQAELANRISLVLEKLTRIEERLDRMPRR